MGKQDHYILSVELTSKDLEKLKKLSRSIHRDFDTLGVQTEIVEWPYGTVVKGTTRTNQLYRKSLRGGKVEFRVEIGQKL